MVGHSSELMTMSGTDTCQRLYGTFILCKQKNSNNLSWISNYFSYSALFFLLILSSWCNFPSGTWHSLQTVLSWQSQCTWKVPCITQEFTDGLNNNWSPNLSAPNFSSNLLPTQATWEHWLQGEQHKALNICFISCPIKGRFLSSVLVQIRVILPKQSSQLSPLGLCYRTVVDYKHSFGSERSYVNFRANVNISRKVFPGKFQDTDAVKPSCLFQLCTSRTAKN